MSNSVSTLQDRLGHRFTRPELLELAVTHPSYLQDNRAVLESNQRLEFLGDAVLQLILTEKLFELFPGEREGPLSKRRSALTKGAFLVRIALEIGLDRALRLGASEESTGGRNRPTALEDAFEALVGAMFVDAGFEPTRRAVLALYGDIPSRLGDFLETENPKGRLQELVQPVHGNNALRYEVSRVSGEDHAREYEVKLYLDDQLLGAGRGPSKKLAEENAARAALDQLPS